MSSVSSSRPSANPSSSVAGFGTNEWLVEEMYQQYLTDPQSVDQAWHDFFDDYRPGSPVAAGVDRAGEPARRNHTEDDDEAEPASVRAAGSSYNSEPLSAELSPELLAQGDGGSEPRPAPAPAPPTTNAPQEAPAEAPADEARTTQPPTVAVGGSGYGSESPDQVVTPELQA